MRKKQAKKLRKAAVALAGLKGGSIVKEYKKLKSIHKNLNHNEKKG